MDLLPFDRHDDGTVVLWLTPNPAKPRGGVVVLDSWLLEAIRHTMEAIAAGPCAGFVLASQSDRVFVAGADLAEIDALDDAALHRYLELGADAFARIPMLGVPAAAAIHGAALGGGLEIAMHCDALVVALPAAGTKPWRMGLPEAGLCICPGWGGTQMLPARVDPAVSVPAAMSGQTWATDSLPQGLHDVGFVGGRDEAVKAARAWVVDRRGESFPPQAAPRRRIGPPDAGRVRTAITAAQAALKPGEPRDHADAVVDAIEQGLSGGWEKAIASERNHLVRLRHLPAARAKLDAFLKR